MTVRDGRYGPYVNHGKVNATLPKDMDPASVTMETAIELLAARAGKAPAKRTKKAAKPKSRTAPKPKTKTKEKQTADAT